MGDAMEGFEHEATGNTKKEGVIAVTKWFAVGVDVVTPTLQKIDDKLKTEGHRVVTIGAMQYSEVKQKEEENDEASKWEIDRESLENSVTNLMENNCKMLSRLWLILLRRSITNQEFSTRIRKMYHGTRKHPIPMDGVHIKA